MIDSSRSDLIAQESLTYMTEDVIYNTDDQAEHYERRPQ